MELGTLFRELLHLMSGSVINRLLLGFCLLSSTFLSLGAAAQKPTAAQIAQFRSLPPAEQKRLAASLGIDISQMNGQPAVVRMIGDDDEPVPRFAPSPREEMDPRRKAGAEEDIEGSDRMARDLASDALEDDETDEQEEDALQLFGYALFTDAPSTFAPATDIPVPSKYILGPGDTVVVQLYGKDNASHSLMVNREGAILFPEIGPINVAGLSFADLKSHLSTTISEQMIGVKSSVTMGPLRSIRVFILGDAANPGSYTVSSLSTITNALLVGGGISEIGSLRHIKLKRNGQVVSDFDLYELLLRGDTQQGCSLIAG